MFLSAGVLTEDERELAFAAVPEMEALRLNRNIALNLIDGKALTTIDGIAGCGGAKVNLHGLVGLLPSYSVRAASSTSLAHVSSGSAVLSMIR